MTTPPPRPAGPRRPGRARLRLGVAITAVSLLAGLVGAVTPSPGPRVAAGWVLAGLGLVAGLVTTGAGLTRARRTPAAAAEGAAGGDTLPPSGWYPAPDAPGRLRYWDGTGWTEHVG